MYQPPRFQGTACPMRRTVVDIAACARRRRQALQAPGWAGACTWPPPVREKLLSRYSLSLHEPAAAVGRSHRVPLGARLVLQLLALTLLVANWERPWAATTARCQRDPTSGGCLRPVAAGHRSGRGHFAPRGARRPASQPALSLPSLALTAPASSRSFRVTRGTRAARHAAQR